METGSWGEITEGIASSTDEIEGKYLSFWTDNQLFGVPIVDVVQIVGMQAITVIPDYPYYAKGIINLRGTIIPITDVRLRLGKPEADYTDRTCIIVTSIHDAFFGFVVDAVNEVTYITAEQIAPPPKMTAGESRFLTGVAQVEEKLILIIDTAKLLGEDGIATLSTSAL